MRGDGGDGAIDILLVEDNPGDARLAREALGSSQIPHELFWVEDGDEAMAFLRQEGRHENRRRPDLIVLDLNLPGMDGREVLKEVKSDPALKRIPVVILTSSEDERDVERSYDLHANCFVSKPIDLKDYVGVVRSVEEFWLKTAKLPQK